MNEEEEEKSLFKAEAVNEEDSKCDHATNVYKTSARRMGRRKRRIYGRSTTNDMDEDGTLAFSTEGVLCRMSF